MRRLLLVDSDRIACGRLARVLTGLGYGLDVTFSAEEARVLNERQNYSWSVIGTPLDGGDQDGGDGVALFTQLRQRSASLRGVLVANETDSPTCRKARSMGLEVLSRPLDVNLLVPWLATAEKVSPPQERASERPAEPAVDESLVGELDEDDIRNELTDAELIRIIRGLDYPFAGKDRLEMFDRDTLVRVVLLIRRWCHSRR
ncbi:MAG: hypothetical protein KF774_05295 [Planctomyces sp.]|nr:hypothetical protein [Planctomyces sp.]